MSIYEQTADALHVPAAIELPVPELDENFFVCREIMSTLEKFDALSRRHPVNVLVTGNQGCGKSSLARQFAAFYGRPLATFQVGLLAEAGQLFGQQRLKGGETYFHSFLFPTAIQIPRCVVHLEEINRSETPHALNELFSVLSEDRSIWIDELGMTKVGPGVVFFATMNEGDGYAGTDELDDALLDRFYQIHMEALPADVEEQVLVLKGGVDPTTAKRVMKVVQSLRTNSHAPVDVSVRHSLMVAELVAVGASLREALLYSLQLSKDVVESVLLSLQAETGAAELGADEYVRYVPGG